MRLQEFENWKWDADAAAAAAGRTDRCEGWNSYVDKLEFFKTSATPLRAILAHIYLILELSNELVHIIFYKELRKF